MGCGGLSLKIDRWVFILLHGYVDTQQHVSGLELGGSMAIRIPALQATHDQVISALAMEYENDGHVVATNPGNTNQHKLSGKFPDVIVVISGKGCGVFEVETACSITNTEAKGQWTEYAKAFDGWYLVVPEDNAQDAETLLSDHKIENATLFKYNVTDDGVEFYGRPNIS